MSATILPHSQVTSDDTPQAQELLRAVTEARLACSDCTPARQMDPDDNAPVPCHYCGIPTYGRTNGRGVCTDCLHFLPLVVADAWQRIIAGRI